MSSPSESDQIFSNVNTVEVEKLDITDIKMILSGNVPTVLKGCTFGPCLERWNLEYLSDKLKEETVVIHESNDSELDFLGKNFKYTSCKFEEFVDKLKNPLCHVYYRSANSNPRTKKPARIEDDLPNLKNDLTPPEYIPFKNSDLYYSSALRIASSEIQIWTHFDSYDNILCQTVGKKRIILIGPDDTKYLYIDGDKSPVNNFDDYEECTRIFPLVRHAKLFRACLQPKDAIFIPALWWHNIRTVFGSSDNDKGCSIGFNIFWKDPIIANSSVYPDGDVYGNKNLIPYEAAVTNLDRALRHLDKLPDKYKRFHQIMLFQRLKAKLSLNQS